MPNSMRTCGIFPLCLLLWLASCLPTCAQYAIDWHTIDGGGGTSTGGIYAVSGTIGQPDAGRMSGGEFTVEGGFWGVVAAVETGGAPLLSICCTATNTIAVSWPSPSTGWNLQQNTVGVSSVNWSNVTAGIHDDGAIRTLILNPSLDNRFYRLHKP